MRWWERQIGGKTRGRIIALLRRKERTVDEIAVDLGVTDNAVRSQLQMLEREGMIREIGTRAHEGAGKPSSIYAMAEKSELSLSAAYAPVLVALLETMGDHLSRKQLQQLLRETGERLGTDVTKDASIEARVRAAAT